MAVWSTCAFTKLHSCRSCKQTAPSTHQTPGWCMWIRTGHGNERRRLCSKLSQIWPRLVWVSQKRPKASLTPSAKLCPVCGQASPSLSWTQSQSMRPTQSSTSRLLGVGPTAQRWTASSVCWQQSGSGGTSERSCTFSSSCRRSCSSALHSRARQDCRGWGQQRDTAPALDRVQQGAGSRAAAEEPLSFLHVQQQLLLQQQQEQTGSCSTEAQPEQTRIFKAEC